MMRQYLRIVVVLCLAVLLISASAQAAVVGRFIRVEGQVDLLKQGRVPALPARVNDGVERGDVIRTKAKGKAQVRFVDDSLVTIAPESRMAVADFTFEPASRQRRAVLRFFKGVFHTVVVRVLKTEQPDFLMQTHTAGLGVRGTENYTVLLPNSTGAYLIRGVLEVRSNNPQIPAMVVLNTMEYAMIPRNQPPMMPKRITPAMLETLKRLMDTGLSDRVLLEAGSAAGISGGSGIPEVPGLPGTPELFMQPSVPPTVTPPAVSPMTPAPPPAQAPGVITPGR